MTGSRPANNDPKSDKNEIVPKNTGIPMKIITFTESKTCKAWIPF